jgi:hypothetical protein
MKIAFQIYVDPAIQYTSAEEWPAHIKSKLLQFRLVKPFLHASLLGTVIMEPKDSASRSLIWPEGVYRRLPQFQHSYKPNAFR